MNRKDFLKILTLFPLLSHAMKLQDLNKMTEGFQNQNTEKMPLLFLGHGSPMNAIEENEFVQGFRTVAQNIPKPNAILCISAHWETKGTLVTAMQNPPTIHDFGGFPQALFEVQYPAPGSPELAKETQKIVTHTHVELDDRWGLDHGAWSVIRHMYPKADIPVIQMSLDYNKTPKEHYELAKDLDALRKKGVLIIGSGNMVHNLRMISWDNYRTDNYSFDWALEASNKMKNAIVTNNHESLINYRNQGKAFELAIPTAEHFLPLLYILGIKKEKEEITLFNDKAVAGSLTMTSLKVG